MTAFTAGSYYVWGDVIWSQGNFNIYWEIYGVNTLVMWGSMDATYKAFSGDGRITHRPDGVRNREWIEEWRFAGRRLGG